MNKILFFLFFFFSIGFLVAQDDVEPTVVEEQVILDSLHGYPYKGMISADSLLKRKPVSENKVYPKRFKENFQSKYQGNEYDYSTSKPRESFWQKLERKIAKIIQSIFGENSFRNSSEVTWVLIRLFAIILVGFLLYFIVKYIMSKDGSFIFGKKNKKVMINEQELHENIHEINFPESISNFERIADFRSAVRYQFLYTLKKLSDKKLIIWNPEKTNKDYVAELKAPHLKEEFSKLSYIFDYVWYGEFSINEQEYLIFKNQYQSFKA
ncbi:DUF4129 domain-containing protein [Chryseobacterium sp.]|uniref:DUF4129 domain-containing protein n=1 Tax=Chryseobacterium sp. TaxID=1871047 RepID=UPI0025BEBE49|nr:DUF4129 domain-containing protein [Chryseobacterium sp.]